jgi:rhamnogalacturonyl hydrolase YesR
MKYIINQPIFDTVYLDGLYMSIPIMAKFGADLRLLYEL